MKIAVTGKGGVGKTTIAATLARLYAEEGHPVLAADVDPDANLGPVSYTHLDVYKRQGIALPSFNVMVGIESAIKTLRILNQKKILPYFSHNYV